MFTNTGDEAYRSYVIFHIPSLEELDERAVRPAERRHAQLAVNELDDQYHHPVGMDTDDEVESGVHDLYDQKRSGEGGSERGRGGVSSIESKGMPMTSEEIIQDYQRSVARVKDLQGRVKQHDDWEEVAQEEIDTGRGRGRGRDRDRDTGSERGAGSERDRGRDRGRDTGSDRDRDRGREQEEDDRTARKFASTTLDDVLDDNRTPFLSSPRSPLRTMTGGSPMDATASQQVHQLLNDMSTAIASVQLPPQLSLTPITLIHMPDLVARSATKDLQHLAFTWVKERREEKYVLEERLLAMETRAVAAEEEIRRLHTTTRVLSSEGPSSEEMKRTIATLQLELEHMSVRRKEQEVHIQMYEEMEKNRNNEMKHGIYSAIELFLFFVFVFLLFTIIFFLLV